MSRAGGQRGNVTIFVAVVIVVAMLLCAAVARLGRAAAAKARADNAADASALAAADRLALGRSAGEACSIARQTAAANGARLLTCRCVTATPVESPAAEVTLEIGDARARARAEVDARADFHSDPYAWPSDEEIERYLADRARGGNG